MAIHNDNDLEASRMQRQMMIEGSKDNNSSGLSAAEQMLETQGQLAAVGAQIALKVLTYGKA